MKRKNRFLWILVIITGFISCDDILEDDITDRVITIISPAEGDIIEGNTVQFLWNTLEGADEYNIQLYNSNTLVLDTIASTPPYSIVLNSDQYEWRIKGMNNGYETQYNFPTAFEVVASADLTNQTVILSSPTENLYTNETSIIFTWQGIPSATSYSFELTKVSGSGTTTVYLEDQIMDTSLALDATVLSEDAEYVWKVKAVNDTSETLFSSRTFFIDTVVPNSPSLVTPQFEEEFTVNEIVTFSWDFGTDPGNVASTIEGTYEVATDAGFTTIVENGVMEGTTFTSTYAISGTYYWRVRGTDQAGNVGAYNQNGKFIVND